MRWPGGTFLSLDGNPPLGRVSPDAVGPLRRWVSPLLDPRAPDTALLLWAPFHIIVVSSPWPPSVHHVAQALCPERRKDHWNKVKTFVNLLWFRRQFIYTTEHFDGRLDCTRLCYFSSWIFWQELLSELPGLKWTQAFSVWYKQLRSCMFYVLSIGFSLNKQLAANYLKADLVLQYCIYV